jgi:hypothetical protein
VAASAGLVAHAHCEHTEERRSPVVAHLDAACLPPPDSAAGSCWCCRRCCCSRTQRCSGTANEPPGCSGSSSGSRRAWLQQSPGRCPACAMLPTTPTVKHLCPRATRAAHNTAIWRRWLLLRVSPDCLCEPSGADYTAVSCWGHPQPPEGAFSHCPAKQGAWFDQADSRMIRAP